MGFDSADRPLPAVVGDNDLSEVYKRHRVNSVWLQFQRQSHLQRPLSTAYLLLVGVCRCRGRRHGGHPREHADRREALELSRSGSGRRNGSWSLDRGAA